jgi:hypothetical protein
MMKQHRLLNSFDETPPILGFVRCAFLFYCLFVTFAHTLPWTRSLLRRIFLLKNTMFKLLFVFSKDSGPN